jgi:predicted  nucleic acid-binding Zn-ribbon protein
MKPPKENPAPAASDGNIVEPSPSAEVLSRTDAMLKRKGEIELRLNEITTEISNVFVEQGRLNSIIMKSNNALGGMRADRYTAQREMTSGDLQQARRNLEKANAKGEALKNERMALMAELPDCTFSISAEDALEHQRQIEQAETEVKNLQSAIRERNQVIAEANATLLPPIDRGHEYQDLVADVALGRATDAELKTLRDKIAGEQKEIQEASKKAAPLIEKAQAALPGLERKLASARSELQALKAKSEEVLYRLYVGEAERAAVQFVNHALRLKELYIRLGGLNLIIAGHDGVGIMDGGTRPLCIPVFRLPQFEGLENPLISRGTFFYAATDVVLDQIAEAAEDEKSRVASLFGIHL